jgi:DNA-binding LacI/PurR family transcriptional regulator
VSPASSRFISLPSQVAETLRDQICSRTWNEWLPSERALAESLQVSRKTLRKAMAQLRREGAVEAVRGLGNRIIDKGRGDSGHPVEAVVVLLTPDPVEQMRPYTSLWIGHLKSLLIEHGFRLRMVNSRKYFSRRPSAALKKLTLSQPAACWLLANSNEATQRWFCDTNLPCVVAGSCHPGIDLPNVDLDHYALCRHAAGVLLGAGHRRIAMLNAHAHRAGDLESETGFMAGVRESPHTDAIPLVIHHDHTTESLSRALQRLLKMPHTPSAILVSNGASYLTIISLLAQCQLRVPDDVSVVSRDDEPFLRFLVPRPTYYAANPHTFAKHLFKPVLKLLSGTTPLPRSTRIIPTYVKGASLGIYTGS